MYREKININEPITILAENLHVETCPSRWDTAAGPVPFQQTECLVFIYIHQSSASFK